MRRLGSILVALIVCSAPAAADDKDPLERARALYNDGRFDAAIASADQARLAPGRADRADLIAARAYLERFRGSGAPDDLTNARERVLDWWASALDREARPRTDIERQAVYQRIRGRMQEEMAARPASTVAAYWVSAAARGQGDLQAAWDAAQAGWVRAGLATDRGASLRADLDRLVLRGIVPERAKALAQPPDVLRQDWERFKERWSR